MTTTVSTMGLSDQSLLDKIDRLSACNVGEYISLPQLVVVGDQSSGKSSVLEGMTDLPFPRDSGLCTRFTTQITFRRCNTQSISVSIIPGVDANGTQAEDARNWKKEGLTTLTKDTFSEIMTEVLQVMGLADVNEASAAKKTFSKDVLKLDISGPDQEHFSVIDVPGIFSRTTTGLTTKQDKQLVREIVRGYMENPRSVILAVIPANVDMATQEILEMAEEVDPHSQRTLGILTKPDLVDKGAEPGVVEVVQGAKHKLNLGWHIVRNPGQSEMSSSEIPRNTLEANFFERERPWCNLEKSNTGVAALKVRLQGILHDMVRREFPHVKKEITKKLRICEQELKDLGLSRETREQQLHFLTEIAAQYRHITTLSLHALYNWDEAFNGRPGLRLATLIVDRNGQFSDDVWQNGNLLAFRKSVKIDNPAPDPRHVAVPQFGHSQSVYPQSAYAQSAYAQPTYAQSSYPQSERHQSRGHQSESPRSVRPPPERPTSDRPLPKHTKSKNAQPERPKPETLQYGSPPMHTSQAGPSHHQGTTTVSSAINSATTGDKRKAADELQNDRNKNPRVRYYSDHTDLEDIMYQAPDTPVQLPAVDIMDWIREEYSRSRGFELGTFDSNIIPLLWKKQSAKWDEFALGYISDIISLVHQFIVEVLSAICHDQRTRDGIVAALMDPITERYRKSVDHVKFLIEVEKMGSLLTTNHYFNENLQKARSSHFSAQTAPFVLTDPHHGPVVPMHALTSTTNMSNMDYTVRDIHDILKSYYKVARKRFVDAVCMQASDYFLVNGPDTPLQVFGTEFVSRLTVAQLEDIAGEDVATRRARKRLAREIEDLEEGRKILL